MIHLKLAVQNELRGTPFIVPRPPRRRRIARADLGDTQRHQLIILADTASTVEEFDLTDLMTRIDAMQDNLAKLSIGEELDRAFEQLDHYKSIHKSLTLTTAF